MAHGELETLLIRIRDALAAPAEVSRAAELLQADERLPDELRAVPLDEADAADAAVALLAVLGVEDGLADQLALEIRLEAGGVDVSDLARDDWAATRDELREGLGVEAGWVDVADEVLGILGQDDASVPLAGAVAAEAGEVDLRDAVLDAIGAEQAEFDLSQVVAVAVRAEAGSVDVVDEVLDAMGAVALPVADAIRAEAGVVDVADAVLEVLGLADEHVPVAAAVRDEAGEANVADSVELVLSPLWASAMLDHELDAGTHRLAASLLLSDRAAGREMTAFAHQGRELREALGAEAGECPPMWEPVAAAIGVEVTAEVPGFDGALLAEAVRAEAGEIDLSEAVMRRIRRSAVAAPVQVPKPANRAWTWSAVALAAIALFAVVLGRSLPQGGEALESPEMQFADAREIVVDDLDYAESAMVQVIQASDEDGAEGALIIWVEEEAVL